MALSSSTVVEVRQTGSDTNGGGFVTGASGTDWSQQTSPQYSVTDGVTAGTTTITSATANFGTDVVGNLVYVQGGTGSVTASWYQIVSRTNATTIVVDRTTGLTAGTGVTLHIGGALGTPGNIGPLFTLGATKAWIKYSVTAYSLTTATPGSGGPVTLPAATCSVEGYDLVRGDRTGNQPQISWAAVAAPGSLTYIFTTTLSNRQAVINIQANGNSVNNVGGINASGGRNQIIQCSAINCNGTAGVGILNGAGNSPSIACSVTNCTTGFLNGQQRSCYATGCTTGFLTSAQCDNCVAYNNSTGFSGCSVCTECTADSNTINGFLLATVGMFTGCVSTNQSGGSGVGFAMGAGLGFMFNCFSYNNTSEVTGSLIVQENTTLNAAFTGGQPYVTPGSDFRPNATAGAGLLLRAASVAIPTQVNNADAGAVQHSDPVGGGAPLSRVFTGF